MYIFFRDSHTGKETPLVTMIAAGFEQPLSERERDRLARLSPEEEYMILMSTLREKKQELVLKERLHERYASWMKKRGKAPVSEDLFEQLVLSRYPGIQEIRIGEKRYWFGICLRDVW